MLYGENRPKKTKGGGSQHAHPPRPETTRFMKCWNVAGLLCKPKFCSDTLHTTVKGPVKLAWKGEPTIGNRAKNLVTKTKNGLCLDRRSSIFFIFTCSLSSFSFAISPVHNRVHLVVALLFLSCLALYSMYAGETSGFDENNLTHPETLHDVTLDKAAEALVWTNILFWSQ